LVVAVTKQAVDRPRPIDPLTTTQNASFPSGHSAYAVGWIAAAVAYGRAAPGRRRSAPVLAAVAIAVVVGVTRIYLRAHYLSDVLAGAGIAAALYALCGAAALVVDFVRHNGDR
jgi:membrane-associated phospholipid phosphatase